MLNFLEINLENCNNYQHMCQKKVHKKIILNRQGVKFFWYGK